LHLLFFLYLSIGIDEEEGATQGATAATE